MTAKETKQLEKLSEAKQNLAILTGLLYDMLASHKKEVVKIAPNTKKVFNAAAKAKRIAINRGQKAVKNFLGELP